MNLTLNHVRKAIAKDNRFDQNIDVLDDGDCLAVWLKDGWSWRPLDGNRHVEHFYLDGDEIHTVEDWKHAVMLIDREI